MTAETFHDFELAGWQMVADTYQQHFGSLTSQTIAPLLDAVDAGESAKLLDIATGPGYAAAAAAQRGADVHGIDFSTVMVALASKMQPGLSFAVGDAENLDYPDETFDAATMNFGILHLERPELALSESYRILKPGGKFAFSIWGTPDEALGFGIVLKAIKDHGDPGVPLPQGPPFFRFSDRDESKKEMEKAGFSDVKITKISMHWHLESAEDFFNAFLHGTPRTGGILRAQTANQLADIKNAITLSLEKYQDDGRRLQIPMVALVVSGTKS